MLRLIVGYFQQFETISDCALRLLDPITAYITASTLSILCVATSSSHQNVISKYKKILGIIYLKFSYLKRFDSFSFHALKVKNKI